jgi:hypothetical protein
LTSNKKQTSTIASVDKTTIASISSSSASSASSSSHNIADDRRTGSKHNSTSNSSQGRASSGKSSVTSNACIDCDPERRPSTSSLVMGSDALVVPDAFRTGSTETSSAVVIGDSRSTECLSADEDSPVHLPQVNLGPSERPAARPNDFEFLKVIGKGSFGKVLLARHRSEHTLFAVKVLQKSTVLRRNERTHIMCERNVLLKTLAHPFLVSLHFSFQTRDKLYFVLDYVNGGELFFHLQKERSFPEPRARFYAAEICSALGYLHSQCVVYRDLKPENILLDCEGHIVLTDFGLCKDGLRKDDTTGTFCGTPEYLAPEVLRKQPYDWTVDWWCLGAVLYEMLFGLVSDRTL